MSKRFIQKHSCAHIENIIDLSSTFPAKFHIADTFQTKNGYSLFNHNSSFLVSIQILKGMIIMTEIFYNYIR